MQQLFRHAGLDLLDGASEQARLAELRGMYEPFLNALSQRFLFTLPPFLPAGPSADNWQRSAWTRRTPGIGSLSRPEPLDDHFE